MAGAYVNGPQGHKIAIDQFDRSTQGNARCECGWSAHHIYFDGALNCALAHARAMKSESTTAHTAGVRLTPQDSES